MHRHAPIVLLALIAAPAAAQNQRWAGTWFTTEGVLELEVDADRVTGSYGQQKRSTLEGTVRGDELAFRYRAGRDAGEGALTLDASGHGFTGTWTGWRQDPGATAGEPIEVAGFWRTSWGMLELDQRGDKVDGGLGAQGFTEVTGEVQGRRLVLRYRAPWGRGEIWGEARDDGAALFGAWDGDTGGEGKWIARRLTGHERGVAATPGEVVRGLGKNRLTYYLRAPKRYRAGKPYPAIVFLHGSNMSALPYLETVAQADAGRGKIGDRFVLIGIDGESWVDSSAADDPRHNYTYVNWMGKSTYQGYPNTHRESPALVAELIDELVQRHGLSKVLVGGHSQGGFLSYYLLMHYPDKVAGVFPISCGATMQCEPDVFDREALIGAQHATPLAVVHGRNDRVVPYSQGEGVFRRFEDHGFRSLRLFANDSGHAFFALHFAEAIEWLDRMSSDDARELLAFAGELLDDDAFRDACAVVTRLRAHEHASRHKGRIKKLAQRIDEYAAVRKDELLAAIEANEDGLWVDRFLDWQRDFAGSDAGAPVMAAFALLREQHEAPARALLAEARKLLRERERSAAKQKYQELVERYYASTLYRRVKQWLADW